MVPPDQGSPKSSPGSTLTKKHRSRFHLLEQQEAKQETGIAKTTEEVTMGVRERAGTNLPSDYFSLEQYNREKRGAMQSVIIATCVVVMVMLPW